jgi:predicted metal-dependent phosphoesterase TrpH
VTSIGPRPPAPANDAGPAAGGRVPARRPLKVDFHVHSREDPKDYIRYTALELFDRASELGYDALAVTNHDLNIYSSALAREAEKRGLLLLPGVEITADDAHIVVIRPGFEPRLDGFALRDLPRLRDEGCLTIAPHPYFHFFKSLRERLVPMLPWIDAIEFTCYHHPLLNLNKRAVRTAREYGKPLIGNSDSHDLRQLGRTYSLVDAAKDPASIIAAVKAGRIEIRTTPMPLPSMLRLILHYATVERVRRLIDPRPRP